VNRVRRSRSIDISSNAPVPMTTPEWRTPMRRSGSHSVISIRSCSLIGPILVSHTKRVPVPRR
jgi:hypothetical protein